MYPNGPSNALGNIPVRPPARFETKDRNIADPKDRLTLDRNEMAPTLGSHIDEIVRAVGATGKEEQQLRGTLKSKFADSGIKSEKERMPFFNPDVRDVPEYRSTIGAIHPEKPPFTGTPAEVYNSFKEMGYNHDKSVEFSKKFMANMHAKYPEWASEFVEPGMSDKDQI
jgi:hypothetical protein